MKRMDLVAFRKTLVTPDTAECLRQLEVRAASLGGVKLVIEGQPPGLYAWSSVRKYPGATGAAPEASMIPAGREVKIRLVMDASHLPEAERRQREIGLLWSLAVPCGLTPWNRHPVLGQGEDTFHCLGPWQVVYDSLVIENRHAEAWSSACVAAQVEMGRWEGSRLLERLIQAQLHRVGAPCGPIDGMIGERTQKALRAMSLPKAGERLEDTAKYLLAIQPTKPRKNVETRGHVNIPDAHVVATTTGHVQASRTVQGYNLEIKGRGRVILDIGE
jgi:hypothetical protein